MIGLTGPNAVGKGEVAAYLQRLGFTLYSLSDIVREEAAACGLAPEREHLIRTGNRLRREGGAGELARRILSRLGDRDVVDSIRNPAEVEVLRALPQFLLLGIRASLACRFQRCLRRGRPGDPATLEEFEERERQENTLDPAAQQLGKTMRLADRFVDNDGDLGELEQAVDDALRNGAST